MKLGLFGNLTSPRATPAMIGDLGVRCESAGLDSLWLGEHVVLFDEMEFPYPGSRDGRIPMPKGTKVWWCRFSPVGVNMLLSWKLSGLNFSGSANWSGSIYGLMTQNVVTVPAGMTTPSLHVTSSLVQYP